MLTNRWVSLFNYYFPQNLSELTLTCLQTYAERAKKLNEEKEREEREGKRQEGDRIRLTEDRRQTTTNTTSAPPQAASPGLPAPASPMGRARQESGGAAGTVQPIQIRQEPLFHSVPPRPQRLLHSEAYIKYIEGLNKDSRSMCNWDRQLNVTQEVNINQSGEGNTFFSPVSSPKKTLLYGMNLNFTKET